MLSRRRAFSPPSMLTRAKNKPKKAEAADSMEESKVDQLMKKLNKFSKEFKCKEQLVKPKNAKKKLFSNHQRARSGGDALSLASKKGPETKQSGNVKAVKKKNQDTIENRGQAGPLFRDRSPGSTPNKVKA